jgi:hypothetical protein
MAPGVLEAIAVDQIKHMYLEPSRSVSLKQHLEPALAVEFKDGAADALNAEVDGVPAP